MTVRKYTRKYISEDKKKDSEKYSGRYKDAKKYSERYRQKFTRRETRPCPSRQKMLEAIKRKINSPDFQLPPTLEQHCLGLAPPARRKTPALSAFRREAQGLAEREIDRLFRYAVATWFDSFERTLRRKAELPPQYGPTCDSLSKELLRLRASVTLALPEAMQQIRDNHPSASTAQIYQAAVDVIDQQLMPILRMIDIWTSGLDQMLDPSYAPITKVLVTMVEQRLCLMLGGDATELKPVIKTIGLQFGDVVLATLIGPFDSGPAVIGGTWGRKGAHAMLFPANLLEDLPSLDSIYSHEMGHLFMIIVAGLLPAYLELVEKTIREAVENGDLNLSVETVQLKPGVEIPAIEFLVSAWTCILPEWIVDLIGCLVSGPPAFTSTLSIYIGALEAATAGSINKVKRVFNACSSYSLLSARSGKKVRLIFEEHGPDDARIFSWLPALAEELGFPETALKLKQLRNEESVKPKEYVWEYAHHDQDNDWSDAETLTARFPFLKFPVSDWDACAHLIVSMIANTPQPALNNKSLKEIFWLNPKMHQEKVDKLKDLLKAGVGKIPADGNRYWLHFVGAAARLAIDELVGDNMPEGKAAAMVNAAGLTMMLELTAEWDQLKTKLDIYNSGRDRPKRRHPVQPA